MTSHFRTVALPSSALFGLRRALRGASRSSAAAPDVDTLLQIAGFEAGAELLAAFEGAQGSPANGITQLSAPDFWHRINDFFSKSGWGELLFEPAHAQVGLLHSRNWAEAEINDDGRADAKRPHNDAPDAPSCAFSTGLLSRFFSALTSSDVAVIELTCRAAGAERCSFAFGSESVIARLEERLRQGIVLDEALVGL